MWAKSRVASLAHQADLRHGQIHLRARVELGGRPNRTGWWTGPTGVPPPRPLRLVSVQQRGQRGQSDVLLRPVQRPTDGAPWKEPLTPGQGRRTMIWDPDSAHATCCVFDLPAPAPPVSSDGSRRGSEPADDGALEAEAAGMFHVKRQWSSGTMFHVKHQWSRGAAFHVKHCPGSGPSRHVPRTHAPPPRPGTPCTNQRVRLPDMSQLPLPTTGPDAPKYYGRVLTVARCAPRK